MKFEQVFGDYKVTIDLNDDTIYVTDVTFDDIFLDISTGGSVTYYRELPIYYKDAFDIINVYQEALALSVTKNLTPELLVELGYKQV